MTLRLLPYGEHALLAEPDDPRIVLALAAAARDLPGVCEVVPAARTVLVVLDPARAPSAVGAALHDIAATATAESETESQVDGDVIVLDVHYDGADLVDTAAQVGLGVDALVQLHSLGAYTVAFCGFAPGFAYLTGLDETLHVARLARPRTRVPAGSVAIAGEFSGVYPRASPGGWRLLGHTDAALWDLGRRPPALLTPGTHVRFRPA